MAPGADDLPDLLMQMDGFKRGDKSLGFTLSLAYIIPTTLITAAFFVFIVGAGLRAQFRPALTGNEKMLGQTVHAEGEIQAAERMVQAEALIAKEPIALQLRHLQTMREMASEHNTTTFLPLPIDLFSAFLKR